MPVLSKRERAIRALVGKRVEAVEKSPVEGYLITFSDGTVIWWRS